MGIAFPRTRSDLEAVRDRLLSQMVEKLSLDPAFCVGWLGGSLGRGNGDALSDIDLFLVVENEPARDLCIRPARVSAAAPEQRLALFREFGMPLSIHENHKNAPQAGTFSAVIYLHPPLIVDWVLVPRSHALRPADTRLLFAHAGIPSGQMPLENFAGEKEPPLSSSQRIAERLAFFWMMAMIAAKYIQRGEAAREKIAWILPFIVDELAGLIQTDSLGLNHLASPSARLLSICKQVEAQFPASSHPKSHVEGLLFL